MVGHYRHASETPFQWRFADGSMMTHFKWHFGPLPILSTTPPPPQKKKKKKNQTKTKQKKNNSLSVLDPLWQNFLDPRLY